MGRELFTMIFLLRLCVGHNQVGIRLHLTGLYLLFLLLQILRLLAITVRTGLVAHLGLSLCRQIITGQEIRITGYQRLHIGHYFFPLSQLHLHQAALITHLCAFRSQVNGFVQVLQRVVVVAYLLSHHAAVVIAISFVRR